MITYEIRSRHSDGLPLILPNNLELKVQWYSNCARGGPYQAEIKATAPDLALWELLEYLRCPITLYSEKGDAVWWGYINGVDITGRNPLDGTGIKTRVGASLDSMFNEIAVAWEDIAVGQQAGPRDTTDWVSDSISQGEYGIKQALWSGESATEQTLAEQAGDILLERHKYPIPYIELDASGEVGATIYCSGWWDTLNWKYCSVPLELALSYETNNYNYPFGTSTIEDVGMGIEVSGGDINCASVSIYVRKVGSPTDNVTVAIYSNPDDINPTTLIQNGSAIDNIDITTSYQWLTSVFSPEVTLTSGLRYFIVVGRSGAADDTDYFEVGSDSGAGYGGGFLVYYNGVAWNAANYSMDFRLYDNDVVQTSTQLLSIITTHGQFFRRVRSEVASGVYSESYRDGDGTAHFEAEQLMRHGTTNFRRMLTKVDEFRSCIIYEEDADTAANYYSITSDGRMYDKYGAQVRPEIAKCGVYARISDAIPPSVDTTFLGNAAARFIEINEYDCNTGKNKYTSRDALDPFVIGRPLDG